MTWWPTTGGGLHRTYATHPKVFLDRPGHMLSLEVDKTCADVFGKLTRFLLKNCWSVKIWSEVPERPDRGSTFWSWVSSSFGSIFRQTISNHRERPNDFNFIMHTFPLTGIHSSTRVAIWGLTSVIIPAWENFAGSTPGLKSFDHRPAPKGGTTTLIQWDYEMPTTSSDHRLASSTSLCSFLWVK